jgi:hypothetical protein
MGKVLKILFLLSTLTFSCTEKIDVGIGDMPPMLVVEAVFTNETKVHSVILKTTSNYYQYEDPLPVTNALVRITDGTDTFLLKENQDKKGIYETLPNITGQEKHTYKLLISNIDIDNDGIMENYTAEEYMNPSVTIDSIHVVFRKPRGPEGLGNWRITCFAQEPETEGNCYLFRIMKNGVMLTDSLDEYEVQYDYMFNGKYLSNVRVGSVRKTEKDSVNIGDIITLESGNITSAYADFISETQITRNGSVPMFGGPSANVWGNIYPLGKALGYFSVYSVYKVDRIYKGEIDATPF